MAEPDYVDFGNVRVTPGEKRDRVRHLFDSVSNRYDLMNDLMSAGLHRLWKRYAAGIARLPAGGRVLDLAGGTGDMARRYRSRLDAGGSIYVCDISREMLQTGRDRLIDVGIVDKVHYLQGDAEDLPFADLSFDFAGIAFGLRNVTDKPRALRSVYRTLKYGRQFMVLEFSRVALPALARLYGLYSDHFIPRLGGLVARDEASYRYLVESIRLHPDQAALKAMMEEAGFSLVEYYNLSGGIVAVHTGYKI